MRFDRIVCAATSFVVALALSGVAHATVVERVVAVVGEHAILLSDLRQRARPFLLQIQAKVPPGAQQAAAESELFRQMLHRMIDDRIESQVAAKHQIRVTSEEVDAAVQRLARLQNISVDTLLGEAIRGGLSAQDYRDEIRRQVLVGKLLELRVKGQIRVTDEAMRALFKRLSLDERRRLPYRPQWIVIRIPSNASPEVRAQKLALANSIVKKARAGSDFAALARRYSDDTSTRAQGGDLGRQSPGGLEDAVERRAFVLEVGEVSKPFPFADALVILRVSDRAASKLGSFDSVRNQLAQRVYAEQMEKAKRRWLDNLKRGVHIDIRL